MLLGYKSSNLEPASRHKRDRSLSRQRVKQAEPRQPPRNNTPPAQAPQTLPPKSQRSDSWNLFGRRKRGEDKLTKKGPSKRHLTPPPRPRQPLTGSRADNGKEDLDTANFPILDPDWSTDGPPLVDNSGINIRSASPHYHHPKGQLPTDNSGPNVRAASPHSKQPPSTNTSGINVRTVLLSETHLPSALTQSKNFPPPPAVPVSNPHPPTTRTLRPTTWQRKPT